MRIFIAIDIGGTAVKYGIVDENGSVRFNASTPTEPQKGREALVFKIDNIVKSLLCEYPEAGGVGISTAGIVDTKAGKVIYANDNLPGYSGTGWKQLLENRYRLKTAVNNDVNSAALAESWVGAARGCSNFFCVTIGSGIGGAAFLNDRLFTGRHYQAAEIGYMRTGGDSDVRYENKASASALVREVYSRTGECGLDAKTVFQKARSDDAVYREVLDKWFDCLAQGLVNVICLYDPSLIVIGGGISLEGKYLIDRIKNALAKYLAKELLEGVEIKAAACGNLAGMIGSVYSLARESEQVYPKAGRLYGETR